MRRWTCAPILISAFPDLIDSQRLENQSVSQFFTKPMDLATMNESIRGLLAAKAGRDRNAGVKIQGWML